jgi:hypothetical protein
VLRAGGARRPRALLEAAAALSGAVGVTAWLTYAERAHDYSAVAGELFAARFSLLGGLPSLVALGTAPEYIVQAALGVPIALALLWLLSRVDGRLAFLTGLMLVLSLSSTGVSAQSTGRYLWTLWPLALAGLRVRDRPLGWALCGLLALWSVQGGIGYVLGTSML